MIFEPAEAGSAWYYHFWPWFIVILLGLSVVGSLFTVAIAYQYRDVDVRKGARVETPSVQAFPSTTTQPEFPSTEGNRDLRR